MSALAVFSPGDLQNIGGTHGDISVPDVPDTTETQGVINRAAWIVITAICIPLAVIALAFFGVSFFMGDKQAEDAKNRAKYALIALAVILMLTVVVNLGRSLASGLTWDPTLTNNQDIFAPKPVDEDALKVTVDNGSSNENSNAVQTIGDAMDEMSDIVNGN